MVDFKADVAVSLKFRLFQEIDDITFGVGVHTTDLLYLTTHNSEQQLTTSTFLPGEYEVQCRINCLPLLPGVYSLRVGITAGKAARTIFYAENLYHFQVVIHEDEHISSANRDGFFALDARWIIVTTPNEVGHSAQCVRS